jgi:L-ascorbate metabolism protein UlaG (beta-lactamase superfamily)
MDIRFLGHAAFELSDGDTRILIDPFITGNPKATVSADELQPSVILLTHGHADHFGDTVDIAKRTGASVLAIVELADEISKEGIETFDPNLGGTVTFEWGWVKLVPAWHTSTTPNGSSSRSAGSSSTTSATRAYSQTCS